MEAEGRLEVARARAVVMSSNCKSVWRISLGWWKCFNTGLLWWLYNLANLLKKKSFKCAHKIGSFYDRCVLSHLCPTVQPCGLQPARLPESMGFSRHDHWNGLPCPPSRHLPNPGIEPTSLTSPALARGFFTTSATWGSRFFTIWATREATYDREFNAVKKNNDIGSVKIHSVRM